MNIEQAPQMPIIHEVPADYVPGQVFEAQQDTMTEFMGMKGTYKQLAGICPEDLANMSPEAIDRFVIKIKQSNGEEIDPSLLHLTNPVPPKLKDHIESKPVEKQEIEQKQLVKQLKMIEPKASVKNTLQDRFAKKSFIDAPLVEQIMKQQVIAEAKPATTQEQPKPVIRKTTPEPNSQINLKPLINKTAKKSVAPVQMQAPQLPKVYAIKPKAELTPKISDQHKPVASLPAEAIVVNPSVEPAPVFKKTVRTPTLVKKYSVPPTVLREEQHAILPEIASLPAEPLTDIGTPEIEMKYEPAVIERAKAEIASWFEEPVLFEVGYEKPLTIDQEAQDLRDEFLLLMQGEHDIASLLELASATEQQDYEATDYASQEAEPLSTMAEQVDALLIALPETAQLQLVELIMKHPEQAPLVETKVVMIAKVAARLNVLQTPEQAGGEEALKIEAWLVENYSQLLCELQIEPTEELIEQFIAHVKSETYAPREIAQADQAPDLFNERISLLEPSRIDHNDNTTRSRKASLITSAKLAIIAIRHSVLLPA